MRSVRDIATEISEDWGNVNYSARPYLSAMYTLDKVSDPYGADTGVGIVAYFLSNASSWQGPVARRIKKELQDMIRGAF